MGTRSALNRAADQERAAGTRTIEEATRIAGESGRVLAVKQFSMHPDDDYLYIVLVEMSKPTMPEFVTMLVNTSCPGCHEGNYFTGANDSREEFEAACANFNKRGRL